LIVSGRLVQYELPFRSAIAAGDGGHASRSGLLLALDDDEGRTGWGEAAPFPGWSLETLPQVELALRALIDSLAGRPRPPGSLGPTIMAWASRLPTAAAALDLAIVDLMAQRSSQPVASFLGLPGVPAVAVPVNALIAGDTPDAVAAAASDAAAAGFGVFKLKIGQVSLVADVARVAALRDSIGPDAKLRLDAGAVWDVATATEALKLLAPYEVEYIEDPVADIDDLAQVAAGAPIPIGVDGLLARSADPLGVVAAAVADVFVLKPAAMGGLRISAGVAAAVIDGGGEVVVTSFLDSAIGLTGAVHLAAARGGAKACGLATSYLLAENVAEPPPVRHGIIEVPQRPGLGVAPAPVL
jgi:o-succinylbenzoate synthase